MLDVLHNWLQHGERAHFHERLCWMSFHFKCLALHWTLHDTESVSVSAQCAETAHTQLCLSLHPSCIGFALRLTVRLPGTIGGVSVPASLDTALSSTISAGSWSTPPSTEGVGAGFADSEGGSPSCFVHSTVICGHTVSGDRTHQLHVTSLQLEGSRHSLASSIQFARRGNESIALHDLLREYVSDR